LSAFYALFKVQNFICIDQKKYLIVFKILLLALLIFRFHLVSWRVSWLGITVLYTIFAGPSLTVAYYLHLLMLLQGYL